jgi:hypothetical protein
MWGVIDGETFKASYILWISFILYGIYLVNTKKLFMAKKKADFVSKEK